MNARVDTQVELTNRCRVCGRLNTDGGTTCNKCLGKKIKRLLREIKKLLQEIEKEEQRLELEELEELKEELEGVRTRKERQELIRKFLSEAGNKKTKIEQEVL